MKKILIIVLLISFNVNAQEKSKVVEHSDIKEERVYPEPKSVEIKVHKEVFSDTEVKILQSLEAKRIELERKSQLLMIREKLLDISESKLVEKIKTLERLESDINKLLNSVDKKEEKRLNDLATVYSSMKPALAAERLNILEDSTVYGILKRMNYKKSAKILEKMQLKKVKIISKMLAEKTLLPKIKK